LNNPRAAHDLNFGDVTAENHVSREGFGIKVVAQMFRDIAQESGIFDLSLGIVERSSLEQINITEMAEHLLSDAAKMFREIDCFYGVVFAQLLEFLKLEFEVGLVDTDC